MKKAMFFFSCMTLLLSLLLSVGCVRTVIKTDHRPAIVRPVKAPTKKFYVSALQSMIPQSLSPSTLNDVLVKHYPHLFTKTYSEDVIPITLSVSAEPVSSGGFSEALQTFISCLTYMIIFPTSSTTEEKLCVELLYHQGASLGPVVKRETVKSERAITTHAGLSPTAMIFFTSYDYGPFSSSELGEIQKVFYEEIAALAVAAYNRNPSQWEAMTTQPSSVKKNMTVQTGNGVKKGAQPYSVIRKSFDAQSNMGKFRIRFNEATPSEGMLSAIQEDVRNFCRTAYRENNPEGSETNLLILREDYRAIGKTLKLYEFTLTLGAVEFIGLQYDNATLLGTITIRLPGGNPENARKWVTENLDCLVEEYNISADNPIEGEYQLSSEKMSADGTYTVAFEVVN